MAGDSACEHFRLGRFSMAETPVFQNATWGNVDAEERLEVDHLGLHLPPLPAWSVQRNGHPRRRLAFH